MKLPFDLGDTEGLSKEEIRKRKRQLVQMQVYGAVGGAAFISLLVLIIIIKAATGGFHKDKEKEVTQAETAPVVSETSEESSSAAQQVADAVAQQEAEEARANAQAQANGVMDEAKILDAAIAKYIADMTLEEKVSALFFVTPEQLTNVNRAVAAGSSTSSALSEYAVGGVLYSERNMVNPDQFLEMVSNTRSFCKYETFMGIADEGGATSPFTKGKLVEESIPSQLETTTVADAYSNGIAAGNRLRSFGLDVNLAPVTDVVLVKGSGMTKRSFGENIEDVISMSKNEMKGMQDASIHSAIKYFPSYGDAKTDGSTGKVSSKRTKEDLEKTEFNVYKQLIAEGADMIMVSAICMPEITEDEIPACMSNKIVTDLLRKDLGYEGIVLTDYVSKSAISRAYKQEAIGVQAILAGCDMIVSPMDLKKEFQGVMDAIADGTITEQRIEESIYRIYRVKYRNLVDYENYSANE